jgi:hypothetical protein
MRHGPSAELMAVVQGDSCISTQDDYVPASEAKQKRLSHGLAPDGRRPMTSFP